MHRGSKFMRSNINVMTITWRHIHNVDNVVPEPSLGLDLRLKAKLLIRSNQEFQKKKQILKFVTNFTKVFRLRLSRYSFIYQASAFISSFDLRFPRFLPARNAFDAFLISFDCVSVTSLPRISQSHHCIWKRKFISFFYVLEVSFQSSRASCKTECFLFHNQSKIFLHYLP